MVLRNLEAVKPEVREPVDEASDDAFWLHPCGADWMGTQATSGRLGKGTNPFPKTVFERITKENENPIYCLTAHMAAMARAESIRSPELGAPSGFPMWILLSQP